MSLDLDHIGIAVADLDAAATQFARLGFRLTARGYHALPPPASGAERPKVGTGNNCAMLGRGYLELIGITDPKYQGRLREALARYQGIHIVAFGTPDAAATARDLRSRGIQAKDPVALERPVEEGGGSELARFAIVEWPADLLAQCYFFAIQHLTREVLWKPGLLSHPNGARSLEGITVAVEDPADFAARLGRVLSVAPERGALQLAAGRVSVVAASALGHAAPSLPYVAGATLGTGDLAGTAEHLSRSGIGFERGATSLRVPPAEACGAFLEFVQA
jgi:catechol 2,3-dioxygenase-like lactoylglutathione lyase family enzyme